jgi:solute:Na+ symporter, SSS family
MGGNSGSMRFQRIDLWIVALYLLVMLLIAFWQRRFADASLENFFLGGALPGG